MKRENKVRADDILGRIDYVEKYLDRIKECPDNSDDHQMRIKVYGEKNSYCTVHPDASFVPMILLHLTVKFEAEHKALLDELETL